MTVTTELCYPTEREAFGTFNPFFIQPILISSVADKPTTSAGLSNSQTDIRLRTQVSCVLVIIQF